MNLKYLIMGFLFCSVLFMEVNAIGATLNNVCYSIRSLLPIVALTLYVVAGLIYGIGKILGQEHRSRTESWAITIVVSATIGLVLGLSAPFIISMIYEVIDPTGSMEFTCEEMM